VVASPSFPTLAAEAPLSPATPTANTAASAGTENYSYDAVGNRKNKTTQTGTESYNYDATYRLTQTTTPAGTENYSYDAVGNRLTGPGPKDTKYQYNAGNQMILGKIFGHDYDNNGNQTSRTTPNTTNKSWINSWDYENRLIKSEQSKGQEKRTVTFKYDPLGRRIEKKLTTIIRGVTKTATWQYVYDGDNIALEIYTNEAGTTEKSWYTHGVSTDEHLALERNGNNYFYHADGLGSITAITDATKAVVQSYIGVKSLKAAAEYKFADSEDEVKKAVGGLYEDMHGYECEDWKIFYAVIYMTDAFFTQDQIIAEFKSTGVHENWKPLLVVGRGSRNTK
jgi:YD repeat-containing protein